MAYPYTVPQTYAPNYYLQQLPPVTPSVAQNAPQQPAQTSSGLIWVQGESGAKSYLVAPGNTVLLMDSESQKFYIKSADASGMPQPLRIFEYAEVHPTQTQPEQADKYVTREEFEKKINEILDRKEVKEK